MLAGECWRTLCLSKKFNMQKLCRRLEINFCVSCAPFVNVLESWLKLYRICLSRTLLANVDWDAGGGELNLTERLSNGSKRLPDAMNAMVTQGASVGTATACSNDSVSASFLVGLFIDTFFCVFFLPLPGMSTAKLYSNQIHRREMNRCGHFFNQNKIARKCQKFGYCLTRTSSLPTLSIRSSKLD